MSAIGKLLQISKQKTADLRVKDHGDSVKDHGDGLGPTPASFGANAPKLGYLRVREGAHGITLRVKDWSTCAAVPERGEALLRAAEEWSAAARKCGKPDPERSGGERPDI